MKYKIIIIEEGKIMPDKLEFDCVLELKEYLDQLAWQNCEHFEEYEKASKNIDSGRLKIKGTKLRTNFNINQY